jgi:hypothetical protein
MWHMNTQLNGFPPLPLPVERLECAFTTSPALHQCYPSVVHVPLSDKVLGVHKNTASLPHDVVKPPCPPFGDQHAQAWEAFYPAGSYKPSGPIKGGFGFYLSGTELFREALANGMAEEVIMAYDVFFEENFDWVKGGKLPGICKFTLLRGLVLFL